MAEENEGNTERDGIVSVCTRIYDRIEELEQRLSPILLADKEDGAKAESDCSAHYNRLSIIEERLKTIIARLNL